MTDFADLDAFKSAIQTMSADYQMQLTNQQPLLDEDKLFATADNIVLSMANEFVTNYNISCWYQKEFRCDKFAMINVDGEFTTDPCLNNDLVSNATYMLSVCDKLNSRYSSLGMFTAMFNGNFNFSLRVIKN